MTARDPWEERLAEQERLAEEEKAARRFFIIKFDEAFSPDDKAVEEWFLVQAGGEDEQAGDRR